MCRSSLGYWWILGGWCIGGERCLHLFELGLAEAWQSKLESAPFS